VFVAFDRRVRVHVGVVTLGAPARLRPCLEALVAHRSRHDFVVSLLVNPAAVSGEPAPPGVPEGVRLELAGSNLGWAGGLHRLRALSDAELFAWVQDDMTPRPGWLDSLVDAADSRPGVGLFGAVGLDERDHVVLHNGGLAVPPEHVAGWSSTDTTPRSLPSDITTLDWVTSKGCLTRVAAFDEVGGPDPRLWPLNRVDLDYSTHLRCHGWEVVLVPQARVRHAGSQSAPSALRTFLLDWRDDWFDEQWADAVAALPEDRRRVVEHPCAEWRSTTVDAVEAAAGQAATRMLVPFAREQASQLKGLQEQHEAELGALHGRVAQLEEELEETAAGLDRARRRVRRLRRRLRQAPQPRPRPVAGLRQRLRRLR
jgi:GT2 family glycosyltransferase